MAVLRASPRPCPLREEGKSPGRLRLIVLAALALAITLTTVATAATPALREYEVKAVFLFNFTQFVEWPEDSFQDANAPFVIGVLGGDPFGKALDETVRNETVNGRALIVERYRTLAELKPCHILFIDQSVSAQFDQVFKRLQHKGTLTVTDADTSPSREVVIRFLNEQKKIRLRINLDSARAEGLTISSKLLRPAEVVGTAGAG